MRTQKQPELFETDSNVETITVAPEHLEAARRRIADLDGVVLGFSADADGYSLTVMLPAEPLDTCTVCRQSGVSGVMAGTYGSLDTGVCTRVTRDPSS